MAIKFRYNITTYTLLHLGVRVTTPSLCYRQNNTTYYVPLLTSRSQTIGSYIYSAASPTICCRYNNTTYYAAKSRTSAAYNIPAGTYTPSAFKSLIEAYMSIGGTRTCTNSFTVTLNNVTTTISAQSVIYYSSFSSGGYSQLVGFGYNPRSYVFYQQIDRSKTTIYCVWSSDSNSHYTVYTKYPITIGTGINFS